MKLDNRLFPAVLTLNALGEIRLPQITDGNRKHVGRVRAGRQAQERIAAAEAKRARKAARDELRAALATPSGEAK